MDIMIDHMDSVLIFEITFFGVNFIQVCVSSVRCALILMTYKYCHYFFFFF